MLLPELYSEALTYEHFEDTPENEDLIRTFTVRNHSGANLALFLMRAWVLNGLTLRERPSFISM